VGVLIVVAVVALHAHAYPLGLVVVLLAVVLAVEYVLVEAGSYAAFDESGVRSKRGGFRREAAWAQVRQIRPEPKYGQVLVVYLREGKPFKLGAPATSPLARDPEYRAKCAEVLRFAETRIR
jgi:hypothetical protein